MQTVFVQAFATEMGDDDFGWGSVSTPDEPTEDLYPVSMEIVKAPESVTVFHGEISDSSFWSNVVLHIVYSNGEEYDVNCDGIDSDVLWCTSGVLGWQDVGRNARCGGSAGATVISGCC